MGSLNWAQKYVQLSRSRVFYVENHLIIQNLSFNIPSFKRTYVYKYSTHCVQDEEDDILLTQTV